MKDTNRELEHNRLRERDDAAPPRFVGAMGVIRWAILGAVTIFAVIMVLSYFGATPWASRAETDTQYHCPMHPTYVSSQPGDCPICGMSLVPIRGEEAPPPDSGHSHGKEAGAAAESSSQSMRADTARAGSATAMYTCPMHPEVLSDKEGRCPECGMYLVPVEAENAPPKDQGQGRVHADGAAQSSHASHSYTSNVAGLVPITLETRRVQMIGLKTGRVERRPIQTRTRLVGYVTVDETRTAAINVRTSGWIQELDVDQTGQTVSRNAPLLSLYSQDLYAAQQDLLVALGARRQSTSDSALVEVRGRVLDAARDRLRLLGMFAEDIERLESTGEARSELTLRSPYAGVVMEKNVVEGEFITPDAVLFRIADLRTIWVMADVYERDIASVRVGTPARMTAAAFPGETFEGKIAFIYPSVSEKTRTLQVRLEFPNPSLRLRPGMYAEVDLVEGGPEVVAIPFDAVMDGGKTQYAFVVHDRTSFEPRLITTGRRSDQWVEVLSGLEAGEEVVTSANFLIDSESRLKAAITGME